MTQPDDPIDALLKAEREAEEAIARRQAEAQEVVDRALETARRVSDRATARMTKVHRLCAAGVKAEEARLWREFEDTPETQFDVEHHPERLAAAVERLAERLTGGGDD